MWAVEIKGIVEKHEALEFLILNKEETTRAWMLRDKILGGVSRFSENECLDLSLPISEFASFFKHMSEVEMRFGIETVNFGHAGDGHVHTDILRGDLSDEAWEEKLDEVQTYLYQYVDDIGGLPSAEHAIGLVKKPYFKQVMSDTFMKYQKTCKNRFLFR